MLSPLHAGPIHPLLAPVQAAMWRAGEAGVEILQMVLEFREGVGPARVEEAWRRTVAATEVLRLGVARDASGLVMGLVPVTDGGRWDVGSGGDFSAWLAADRLRGVGPVVPWRVTWWPEERRWVWTVHHGLIDGRSMARILRAFLARVRGGPGESLPWARWERATEAMREAAAQWAEAVRSRLQGVQAMDFAGGERGEARVSLGTEAAAQLRGAAAGAGVSTATVVTWAWAQVIARATGGQEALLGQVRAGAPVAGAGFTMNTLPLLVARGPASPAAWQRLAADIRAARCWERTSAADWPHAANWAGLVMIERGDWGWQLGAADLLSDVRVHERSSAPLTATAHLEPAMELAVEAGPQLGAEAAATLLEAWAAALRAVAEGRGEWALASPHEDGGPSMPGPAHLRTAWRQARRRFARETAIWSPGESWSYECLGRRIDRLAGGLTAAGLQRGQTVAVRTGRRRLWPLALLAIASLSAVYVPLGPRLPAARARAMVRSAAPALLISEQDEDGECHGVPRVDFESPEPQPAVTAAPPDDPPTGKEPLALLYTSGSTGTPKGVILGQSGVLNEVRWVAQALGLKPGDRLLQFASPGFDAALEEMLACLLSGATLVPRPDEVTDSFPAFQQFVHSAGITVLDLPTAFWAAWSRWLVETGQQVPTGVRATMIGGERATAKSLADWREAGGRTLWNTYGPTETSIVATAMEIGTGWSGDEDPPIGRPLPGYRVRVADAQGEARPDGAAGELWIGGAGVGPGYWKPEPGVASAFVERDGERWYRTGDHGRWGRDGTLRFLGRQDDQVKIRGHRVELAEVAAILERCPGVAGAHVGTMPDGDTLALTAWVRWAHPPPPDWAQALRKTLAAQLPAAAVPSRWAAVDRFPLTERGKLDRAALPKPVALAAAAASPPQTATEHLLAGLWRDILGVSDIGREDDFLALGGHSLAALRLFDQLARTTGVHLPLGEIMRFPTLRALAAAIDATRARGAVRRPDLPAAVTLHAGAAGQPLFCVHGGDGGVFIYRRLADHLARPRPLVTLESPALSATSALEPTSVETAAARYLEVVRQYQPHGPYHLAGYSFGGVMAFEMARRLRAAGEPVRFLALLDTENPAGTWRRRDWPERLSVRWNATAGSPWSVRAWCLARRLVEGVLTRVRHTAEQVSLVHRWRSRPHSALRALQVRAAHAAAMDAYTPQPLDVPVLLCRTQAVDDKFDVPPDYGWSALTPQLTIRDVPGEHLTIFSPRHAPALARVVEEHLSAS